MYIDAVIDEAAQILEKERLIREIEDKKSYLRGIESKLSNPSFLKNAPEQIVRAEMEKRSQATIQLKKLEEKYASLS